MDSIFSQFRYDPKNWYWAVAGNPTQVYSSASAGYVPLTDPTYQSWLQNNQPTFIDSEASLWQVLSQSYPQGIPAAGQPTLVSGEVNANFVIFRVLFWLVNQVLTLQSKPTLSRQQFINQIANLPNP
jgi:hypothetical protein